MPTSASSSNLRSTDQRRKPKRITHRKNLLGEFENCPLTDFTQADARAAFAQAIANAEKQMPWPVPVVVNGRTRGSGDSLHHVSPNLTARIAATTTSATVDDVEQAIGFARKAWPVWRDLPLETRAARIEKLGLRLAEDRFRLAAMEVHEQGKPWREADADVAEAVDFCRYYARQGAD